MVRRNITGISLRLSITPETWEQIAHKNIQSGIISFEKIQDFYLPILTWKSQEGSFKLHTRTFKVVLPHLKRVYFKKIIVEDYRAVGSLNTKMISFSLRTFCCCCCSLLVSVSGETCKSAIKRPIKVQMHHVVRKPLKAVVTHKKLINK